MSFKGCKKSKLGEKDCILSSISVTLTTVSVKFNVLKPYLKPKLNYVTSNLQLYQDFKINGEVFIVMFR